MLDYYLNAATNMMDAKVARECTELMMRLLRGAMTAIDPSDSKNGPLLCIGPEMAGGVMVGQMACLWSPHSSDPHQVEFVYMRKTRKKSGTKQQLEASSAITSRTPDSPVATAVWVDDVLSTGTSMREGIEEVKASYNIEVRAAIFLVDRSADRAKGGNRCVNLESESVSNVRISAAFDLAEIDPLVPRRS